MKRYFLFLLVLAFVLMSTQAQAGEGAIENFEKIKSLAGEWQGKGPEGKSVLITYEVVSNGSVVMERMQTENEPTIVLQINSCIKVQTFFEQSILPTILNDTGCQILDKRI